MALRFTVASSSDWPPDKNVTPRKRQKQIEKHSYRELKSKVYLLFFTSQPAVSDL